MGCSQSPAQSSDTTQIELWLRNDLALPQYIKLFIKNGYDRFDAVYAMNEDDLKKIGVKQGHRKVILQSIADMQQPPGQGQTDIAYGSDGVPGAVSLNPNGPAIDDHAEGQIVYAPPPVYETVSTATSGTADGTAVTSETTNGTAADAEYNDLIEAFKVFAKADAPPGHISRGQLWIALTEMGDDPLSEQEANEFIDGMEVDEHGYLNFEQFTRYLVGDVPP